MNTIRFRSRGFTLLEVIMVIAIIAILATLALPSQLGQITQKRIIETLDLVERYKAPIELYYYSNGAKFPDSNDQVGLPEPEKIIGNYLQKMEIRDGVMHLTLGNNLPENLHGKILSIRPLYVEDSPKSPVSWVCGYSKKPDSLVPAGTNLTDIEKLFLPGRCR